MILDAFDEVSNPKGRTNNGVVLLLDPIGLAVHHTVTFMRPDASEADERAHIRAIDAGHVALGYGGFAYHGITFPSGRSYKTGNLSGQRAHVARRNHELRGWALVGDFVSVLPAQKQLDGLREGLHYLGAPDLLVRGHNDWAFAGEGTACPGKVADIDWDVFLKTGSGEINYTREQALHALTQLAAAYGISKFKAWQSQKDLDPFDKKIIRDLTSKKNMG